MEVISLTILIDLIIVAIIAISTFIGYKRGLVKIAFGFCTFIIALIVALVLYKPVSSLVIANTEIDDTIEKTIIEKIFPDNSNVRDEENLEHETNIVIDEEKTQKINLYSDLLNTEATVNSIAQTFSTKIIEMVVLIVLYIIAKIILRFITAIADLVAKLPFLNSFNHLGGIIIGFIQGSLIVLVAFALIVLFTPMIDGVLIDNINNSIIGSKIYEHNILLDFIAK